MSFGIDELIKTYEEIIQCQDEIIAEMEKYIAHLEASPYIKKEAYING